MGRTENQTDHRWMRKVPCCGCLERRGDEGVSVMSERDAEIGNPLDLDVQMQCAAGKG